jgi:predicted  nucleic acid-binding Zn-ribbon protein
MGEFTPLECFLAGVAVADPAMALPLFFAKPSVAKRRKQLSDSFADLEDGMQSKEQNAKSLHERLQATEKRLSELEEQVRRQVMA